MRFTPGHLMLGFAHVRWVDDQSVLTAQQEIFPEARKAAHFRLLMSLTPNVSKTLNNRRTFTPWTIDLVNLTQRRGTCKNRT
jgi:hypothetical protein